MASTTSRAVAPASDSVSAEVDEAWFAVEGWVSPMAAPAAARSPVSSTATPTATSQPKNAAPQLKPPYWSRWRARTSPIVWPAGATGRSPRVATRSSPTRSPRVATRSSPTPSPATRPPATPSSSTVRPRSPVATDPVRVRVRGSSAPLALFLNRSNMCASLVLPVSTRTYGPRGPTTPNGSPPFGLARLGGGDDYPCMPTINGAMAGPIAAVVDRAGEHGCLTLSEIDELAQTLDLE